MVGWFKVKAAAKFAGVSERTFRDLLKQGLKHSRLPSGTILVKADYINQFLESYIVNENLVDDLVNEALREFKN